MNDPVTGEDRSGDMRVLVRWVVLVENDGVKYPKEAKATEAKATEAKLRR
jgi:hypothetical protein